MSSAHNMLDMQYLDHDEAVGLLTREGPAIQAQEVRITSRPRPSFGDAGMSLKLNADTEVHLTTEEAATQLLKFLEVPQGFAKDTPQKLISPILEERLMRHRNLVVVTDESGALIELKKQGDLQPMVDPHQLLANIEEQFPEVLYQKAETKNDGTANLLAITQSGETRLEELLAPGVHHFLPEGGDPFRSGLHLKFSTTGLTAPMVEPYMVRLWCLNGAIHSEYLSQWARGYGEGDEIWQYFREAMAEAAGRTHGIMTKYAGLVTEIEGGGQGRRAAVEGLIHAAGVRGNQANDIRDRAIVEPPATHFDIWSLLTANATHAQRNFGESLTRMTRAAAFADAENAHTWCATCGRQ